MCFFLLNLTINPSVRATGGVYKGQGRVPGGLMNQIPVQIIPSYDKTILSMVVSTKD